MKIYLVVIVLFVCFNFPAESNNCNSPAGDAEATTPTLAVLIAEATCWTELKDETAIAFPFTLNEVSVGDLEKSKPKNIVVLTIDPGKIFIRPKNVIKTQRIRVRNKIKFQ